MSYQYIVLMSSTAPNPLDDALNQAARVLGGTVSMQPDEVGTVVGSGLQVTAVAADDEDREMSQRYFGFSCDVDMSIEELGTASPDGPHLAMQAMMRLVMTLVGGGTVGVFLEQEYEPSATILTFARGQASLNEAWSGWTLWPEVLEVVPQPHLFAPPRSHL